MRTIYMNTITSILTSLILSASVAFAGNDNLTPKQAAAVKEAAEQVKVVVYSLENVTNGTVVEDLKKMVVKSGGALTMDAAAEIAQRFTTGLQLLVHIIKSKDIPEEKKADFVDPLGEAIGDLFMVTMRHHGDDPLAMDYAKRIGVLGFLKRTMFEFGRIPSDLWLSPKKIKDPQVTHAEDGTLQYEWNGANVDGKRVFKFWDRMLRNHIGREMILDFQKAAMEIGDMADTKEDGAFRALIYVKKKQDGNDLADAERAYALRMGRLLPHVAVLGSVVGAAVVWAFSGYDFIGASSGDPSNGNVRVVDAMAFGFIGAIGFVKSLTMSWGTIPPLKRLIEMAKEPAHKHKFSRIYWPLSEKINLLRKKMQESRGQVACKLSVK